MPKQVCKRELTKTVGSLLYKGGPGWIPVCRNVSSILLCERVTLVVLNARSQIPLNQGGLSPV
ncbi:MAG TPA: hypothetical protein PKM59_15840, partial [Thermodesulfobacteriota bacterium]|nr:hypothetical protein [Thermodesulfobacteriota bacterium]